MATYRYIFCDMRTDQVIEEIDLFGVYCLRQLNQPGQFNASFSFDQSGKNNADLVAATTPGKTWLVIEREGVVVYGGIVWSRTYQSQAKVCEIFGWGFEAYPQRQVVLGNLDFVQPTTTAFRTLWSDMQGVAGRNLNINVPVINSGPSNVVTAMATDYKYYSELMDAIADGSNGFDWTIDISRNNNGSYAKNLRIGYPTLGTTTSLLSQVVFEYPGNILNYYATDSMAEAGTNIFVVGAGEGSTAPVAITSQTDMIDLEGWPRWDFVSSHKDISDPDSIEALAATEQINRTPPAPTYKVEVAGAAEPIFGSYNIGDAVNLIITDARYPSPDGSSPGLDLQTRLIGWEIRPPDSTQIESINLLFPGDTVNG